MTRRSPTQYNWSKLEFDETLLTKHFSKLNGRDIQYVVVHHMTIVGKDDATNALTGCYNTWQSREASAHYGVQGGNVRQFVLDKDFAWATGSNQGNLHGISIEHANSTAGPKWLVSEKTWKTGARLAANIHKVYKLGRPVSGKTLRWHGPTFASTACPGPYVKSIWEEYVKEAQRVYDEITKTTTTPKPPVVVKPPVVEPKPEPVSARWFKVGLVNHGAATAVFKNPVKAAKWPLRRKRLVNLVESIGADVIGGLECGGTKPWHYISTKYKSFGYKVVPGGKSGRQIFINPDVVTDIIESGSFDPPRYKNNDMPAPWFVGEVDGSKAVVVLFHLDFRHPHESFRVKQAKYIIAEAKKKAVKHNIGNSRIVFMGDMASDNAVRVAFKEAGWEDAFNVAAKTEHKLYKSYNEYKKPKYGPRVDGIFVYKGRPVQVVSMRLDSVATDHHPMAAVINRK